MLTAVGTAVVLHGEEQTLLLVAAAFLTPFSIRKPSLSVRRKRPLRGTRRRRKERKDGQL